MADIDTHNCDIVMDLDTDAGSPRVRITQGAWNTLQLEAARIFCNNPLLCVARCAYGVLLVQVVERYLGGWGDIDFAFDTGDQKTLLSSWLVQVEVNQHHRNPTGSAVVLALAYAARSNLRRWQQEHPHAAVVHGSVHLEYAGTRGLNMHFLATHSTRKEPTTEKD